MAKQHAIIKFTNAYTEETVRSFRIDCRNSFTVMNPFFDKKADKWSIGKNWGYFWGGGDAALFSFSYAGVDSAASEALAIEAYELALATLASRGKIVEVENV